MRFDFSPISRLVREAHFPSSPTLVFLAEQDLAKSKWAAILPGGARDRVTASLERRPEPLKAGERHLVAGQRKGEGDLWIAVLPNDREAYFLLEAARDAIKDALNPRDTAIRLILIGGAHEEKLAEALGAALAARTFLMPVYGKREKDQKPWKLATAELMGSSKTLLKSFEYGFATGEGTNIARSLATMPPNFLNTEGYGRRIREIGKRVGLGVKFHSNAELRKMGAGAFTAVDQGNPESAGGIWELSYDPRGKTRKTIHLVGKGMCFDTGGYDVKVGGNMRTMKGDMQGSAVALATLVTAAQLEIPYRMKAYLAVTENHISPRAYKADEVVTALNGLTIEVINTDAEGRMVLADTLTLASRAKPDLVIDFATLTGSAVRSIGTKYSAGFTNRETLHDEIKRAGRESGERIWTFPIDVTFHKGLRSEVADTLQCLKGPGPDHIVASCFLSKFIENDVPWVHIDLSASENEGGIGHVDSLFSGFGVRWALEFIQRGRI